MIVVTYLVTYLVTTCLFFNKLIWILIGVMAMSSTLKSFKVLLTSTSDTGHWFEKFRYHLLEQNLIMPVPADEENLTALETTAMETMKKSIVIIYLMNSMDTEIMFTNIKNPLAPRELTKETL